MRLGPLRVKGAAKAQLGFELEPAPHGLPVLETKARGARFLALPVVRVLNPPATTGMGFWSLNPYVGCEFGCSYCYARKTHQWTMERASAAGALPSDRPTVPPSDRRAWEAFEHEILVKHAAPEVLLRTLEPEKLAGAELVIGTATDPYQPAERRFLLTRRLLEALLRFRGLSLGLITKSPLVTRDLDVLTRLSERHELSVNLSLASMDAALLRRLEARSPAPHARIRALERLARAGIHAGLLIAPILPGITDSWTALAALMEAARGAGARYVHGGPLRLGPAARAGFLPLLEREFPELVARYRRRYGGNVHAGKEYERALARRLRTLQEAFGFSVTGDQ
ncbi:MAG TPA: radical SAM protein [Gemmatimonadales bacterium]|jgi:DNA repair photolyase|nr:radical SAM protein [Gemmatimonadales bacterium]